MKTTAILLIICLAAPAMADVSKWVPVDIDNGHIIIPVTLNGEPGRALLDTGANGNFISQAYLDAHPNEYAKGRGVVVHGLNESHRTAIANNIRLGLFGAEFEMDRLAPILSDEYDLVIGLPFFELFVVQIDYPRKRLRIIDHESIDMRKLANVKMRRASGSAQPQVRVRLNGEAKAWLMLDTGNNGPLLYGRSNAERRGWLEDFAVGEGDVTGANDALAGMDIMRLPSLAIGPFELEDVLVGVSKYGDSWNFRRNDHDERTTGWRLQKRGKTTDGILGYDILRHFIVTIDLKRSRLNLDVPRDEDVETGNAS